MFSTFYPKGIKAFLTNLDWRSSDYFNVRLYKNVFIRSSVHSNLTLGHKFSRVSDKIHESQLWFMNPKKKLLTRTREFNTYLSIWENIRYGRERLANCSTSPATHPSNFPVNSAIFDGPEGNSCSTYVSISATWVSSLDWELMFCFTSTCITFCFLSWNKVTVFITNYCNNIFFIQTLSIIFSLRKTYNKSAQGLQINLFLGPSACMELEIKRIYIKPAFNWNKHIWNEFSLLAL